MQDVADMEMTEMYRPNHDSLGSPTNQGNGNRDNNGFIVQGGPWEQQPRVAPNTASVTEFPSFGGRNVEEPQTQTPIASAWGPRRS